MWLEKIGCINLAVYPFEMISRALFDMDHHKVDGKIVVTIEDK